MTQRPGTSNGPLNSKKGDSKSVTNLLTELHPSLLNEMDNEVEMGNFSSVLFFPHFFFKLVPVSAHSPISKISRAIQHQTPNCPLFSPASSKTNPVLRNPPHPITLSTITTITSTTMIPRQSLSYPVQSSSEFVPKKNHFMPSSLPLVLSFFLSLPFLSSFSTSSNLEQRKFQYKRKKIKKTFFLFGLGFQVGDVTSQP